MDYEVLGAALAVVGALLWIRRDLRHDIAEIRRDVRARGRSQDQLAARVIALERRQGGGQRQ